jgi:SIT4-associating protein SAP185/190
VHPFHPVQCADSDKDDAWGVFTSGSQDDGENPFGDDNFVPSVPPLESRSNPLTPHDWASEFDREFATNEPIWSAEDEGDGEANGAGLGADGAGDAAGGSGGGGGPSIVVPLMDDEEEATPATPGSSWSFTGEDEGEDLPPTMSPTTGHVEVMKKDEAGLAEALESMEIDPERERKQGSIPASASASASEVERGAEPEATSTPTTSLSIPIPVPVPIRSPPTSNNDIHPLPSPIILGQAISPPDPSLIAAATEDAPLGPGVSPDTQVTPSGTLRKEVDGRMVEVPADEVALGVEEATRQESG